MISPGPGVRVLIGPRPVDFRTAMDGLATYIQMALGADPRSGVTYVFRAGRADRVKLVWFDGTGLCPMHKRLEAGAFRWSAIHDGVMRLTSAQLAGLLEGAEWHRIRGPRVARPQFAG